MSDEIQTIKVGDLVLVKKGGEYIGSEIVWGENVLNRSGATYALDMLQSMFTKTGWVTQTILRAPENQPENQGEAEVDAQIEEATDQSSDAPDKGAKKSRRKISTPST